MLGVITIRLGTTASRCCVVVVRDCRKSYRSLIDWTRRWSERERTRLCSIGDDEFISVGKVVPFLKAGQTLSGCGWNEWSFFSTWYTQATLCKAMRCHGIRVPSPYLFDRGMIVIPTSVTVADANTRAYLFEHPPGQYSTEFDGLNTKAMRKRTNMLVLDWRRWLYFL